MGIAHDLGLVRFRRRLPSPGRALRARSFPLRAPAIPGGVAPPEVPGRTASTSTPPGRRWPARMCRAAIVEGPMRAMVQVLASPRRASADRLADLEGPAIFAANHHSHLDTPLLLTSIPEPWRHRIVVGAASDYFFGSRVSGTVAALTSGAIPIERARVGRRSADLAAGLIDDGWSLLIYPEGGRSPDGWGQPFRGGAAYLSLRCGVPVVPIHVSGTSAILRKGRTLPRPRPGDGDLRGADQAGGRREGSPIRGPDRRGGDGTGRRGQHRLVLSPQASPRRCQRHPHRPRCWSLAPPVGPQRRPPDTGSPLPSLARPVSGRSLPAHMRALARMWKTARGEATKPATNQRCCES